MPLPCPSCAVPEVWEESFCTLVDWECESVPEEPLGCCPELCSDWPLNEFFIESFFLISSHRFLSISVEKPSRSSSNILFMSSLLNVAPLVLLNLNSLFSNCISTPWLFSLVFKLSISCSNRFLSLGLENPIKSLVDTWKTPSETVPLAWSISLTLTASASSSNRFLSSKVENPFNEFLDEPNPNAFLTISSVLLASVTLLLTE